MSHLRLHSSFSILALFSLVSSLYACGVESSSPESASEKSASTEVPQITVSGSPGPFCEVALITTLNRAVNDARIEGVHGSMNPFRTDIGVYYTEIVEIVGNARRNDIDAWPGWFAESLSEVVRRQSEEAALRVHVLTDTIGENVTYVGELAVRGIRAEVSVYGTDPKSSDTTPPIAKAEFQILPTGSSEQAALQIAEVQSRDAESSDAAPPGFTCTLTYPSSSVATSPEH